MQSMCRMIPFEVFKKKEGVGMLDGRAFVCCFCLSATVLELTKLVGELREEMTELRESVEVLSKENDVLVKRVIVAEDEWRVERGGRLVEMRKKPVSASRPGGGGGRGDWGGGGGGGERGRGARGEPSTGSG